MPKVEIQKILSSYPGHQVANYLLVVNAFQENDYTRPSRLLISF